MKNRIFSVLTAAVMGISFIKANNVSAADQQCSGTKDGYDWEFWNRYGYGTVSMEPGSNGTFSCSWSDVEECYFYSGKRLGGTKPWYIYCMMSIDYDVDFKPDGNSYMCVYGWTENPTVEYYIVEAWGTWRPPGQQESIGTVSSDGKLYDIYTLTRYDQPSIHGTETFEQYWSVNRTNPAEAYKEKNIQGTVTVTNHFEQWEKCGLSTGCMFGVSLGIDGYHSSGNANVKKNILKWGCSDSDPNTGASGNSDVDKKMPLFGDVNEDGIVDLTDLSILSVYLMGGKSLTSSQRLNADVQYDGEVDIADLALFKQYICKDPDISELGKGYSQTNE